MRRGTRLAKAKVKSPTKQSKRPSLAKCLAEALEQQTATSEILGVISSSRTDVQPVFDTIVRSASRLCGGEYAIVVTHDGELVHLVAQHNPRPGAAAETAGRYPLPLGGRSPGSRAILERRIVHVPDVELETELGPDRDEALRFYRRIDLRASITVPMVRGDAAIGAISVSRAAPGQFSERQIELLKTFADQAVIAIENVRLFTELQEKHREVTAALEQQTATAEILRVISRSPAEFQSVFDTIVANAVRVCQAFDAVLVLADGDEFVHRAHYGPIAAVASARYPLQGTVGGRAMREARVIHVENLAEAPDYPAGRDLAQRNGYRTTLSVPLIRDGVAIGAITIRRTEVLPFTDQQIALLQTFADQAVIAIENARLLTELQTSNREVTEALGRETATAEILRAISSSPTDVQPVFEVIAETAARVLGGENVAVVRFDGQLIHLAATNNMSPAELEGLRRTFPIPPGRGSVTARAILTRAVAHVHDITTDPEIAYRGLIATGFRTALSVPILHGGDPVGAISLGRRKVEPFSDQEIALLQTFADQAVIAIENVRLFRELEDRNRALTDALDRQTATAEVLRAISASPTDAQPVFDTIAASATRLTGGVAASVYEYDGQLVHLRAIEPPSWPHAGRFRMFFPRPLAPDYAAGRVILDRAVLHVADLLTDPDTPATSRAWAEQLGVRSVLWVPLLREGEAIGVIGVVRGDPGRFSDDQVRLLQTFADQAVIAIENVRRFKELQARNHDLTTALDRQTATAEILRVISRSQDDAQPVFETIASNARRLLRGWTAAVFRFDGELVHLAATDGAPGSDHAFFRGDYPRRPTGERPIDHCILDGAVNHVPDAEADAALPPRLLEIARAQGWRAFLQVPMLRDGRPVGALSVARAEAGAFAPAESDLLRTFADQAVIAIENARLLTELQERTQELTRSVDELTALGEVGRAVSSTLDLDTVLQTIVTRANQLAGTAGCTIWEYDAAREEFSVRATHFADPADAAIIEASGRPTTVARGRGVTTQVLERREPVQIPDITVPGAYESVMRASMIEAGHRALLGVPLLRENEVIGVLTVTRKAPGEFEPHIVRLLGTFATQSVLAIHNARLFDEIQRRKQYSDALVETSPVAITTLDLNGTVVGWNPGAERLFGYTPAEAIGRPIDDLVGTPGSRAEIEANMLRTRSGERVHAITRRARKDGTFVDVEISSVPVEVEGTQVGVIATYHDITELLHARRAAEAANEAKGAFLATMSHEIRTPMNAVIGMSGLLLNTALDDEQREYAEVIRQSGDALLTVINDILDFSKIEAGRLELESLPFDLRECIEGALDLVATRAAEKGLDLAYLIADGTPTGVTGDVTRLRQVLLNLLSNAVKFTERGEIVLAASARCLDETEALHELTFSVRDTGVGIPADRLGRLFQSFSQADASTTRRYGGTGLGLAISKRLTELMGGGIAVTSEVGVGSEFTFTIRAAAAEVPVATRRDLRGEQPALRGKRVLAVDDNATNRRILAAHLDAWGVEVRATESPAEALAWVRAGERFDIGVLDMHMPEMDGVDLAHAIREELRDATPPLILFTSLGRREARAESEGFAAYLSKPIKPSQLFDALVSVLPDQPVHVPQRGATRAEFDPDMARRHPLRILLAEDNVVNQKLALRMLAQMGYRADLAANGLEAVDAVDRQTYDVILMDVQMPELDGFEASREITRRWPRERRPRIVAMTANALQGDRELCEAAGMDDYVAKPIRVEELVAALERCGARADAGARAMSAPQIVAEPSTLAPAVDRTVYERLVETMSAAFVVELTDTFVEDGRQLVETLRRAFDAGDLDAFRRAAHSLKSNGDTLGAAGLAAQARALEAMARAGSLGGARDRIEPLAREYERVIVALGELRHGFSA